MSVDDGQEDVGEPHADGQRDDEKDERLPQGQPRDPTSGKSPQLCHPDVGLPHHARGPRDGVEDEECQQDELERDQGDDRPSEVLLGFGLPDYGRQESRGDDAR